jgi:hypothetical protein
VCSGVCVCVRVCVSPFFLFSLIIGCQHTQTVKSTASECTARQFFTGETESFTKEVSVFVFLSGMSCNYMCETVVVR